MRGRERGEERGRRGRVGEDERERERRGEGKEREGGGR